MDVLSFSSVFHIPAANLYILSCTKQDDPSTANVIREKICMFPARDRKDQHVGNISCKESDEFHVVELVHSRNSVKCFSMIENSLA